MLEIGESFSGFGIEEAGRKKKERKGGCETSTEKRVLGNIR
jgi:hypothetical protein